MKVKNIWVRHLNALPEDKIKAICQDYKAGMKAEDVAKKNNVCYKVVSKYLHMRGIPIRGQRIYSQELLDRIEADYYLGIPATTIANKYNITYDALNGVIKTYFEKRTHDNRGKAHKVIKMDLSGNEVKTYNSVTEASQDNNVGVKYIRYVCNGEKEQTKGYKYKWG